MISQPKIILCRFVPAMLIALVISGALAGSAGFCVAQQVPGPMQGKGGVLVTNKYDGPLNITIKGPGAPEQKATLLSGGGVTFFLPPGPYTISYTSTREAPQPASGYSSDHVNVTISADRIAEPITFGGKSGTWHGDWIIKGNWTGPISIRFDDSGESGWTQAQKSIVREAMKEWTDASNGVIQFTEVSYNANLNLKWENPPSNTPVHVYLHGQLYGEMTGGHGNQAPTGIDFNPYSPWYFDDDPTSDKPIPKDKVDFLSVAKHELGHAIGLHHTDSGTMHTTIGKGERHRLAPIDFQAVAIHYPDTRLAAAQRAPASQPSTPQIGLSTPGLVGDVTLTGLPLNTTVSLTNEVTKEKVEQKTDDRGFVRIPLTEKKWQAGRHSVTCQIDGKPVSSRIFLRDGANRVDLTALTYSARPLDPVKAQKVDEALKKSSATLRADPKNSQALLTQGSALNRLGQHAQALSKLAQAAKFGSTHPALAFEIGWSLMRLGMYNGAIAQLEKYEKTNPGLGQTSEFIGRSHLFMGELDKADAKFNEALKRDPRLASTVRFHQAILETLRKNPEAASKYIAALLKEAPNSPTAQLFKNALLQAPGAKPPAGAGAKDYKLSDPIRIQLPPTTAGDVAGAIAKGVVGGLLGGLFGGGGRREPEGPNLVAKPALPETMLTSKDGKTKINLSGAIENGKPYFVMGVQESPGNGAPHLILLQDKNCNVMQPKETSVTAIWEQWMAWKLTVNWTKSYYEDGRLVKQEKGSWSTPWNEFKIQVKDPSELPGIWKDFNSKPFEGIKEVMSTFDAPPGGPFNPADWNLITHATTDASNNQLVTAPFVTGLGTDQNNNLIFKPMDQTVCESTPPSTPLLVVSRGTVDDAVLVVRDVLDDASKLLRANMTTFPWTVGPFGIDITTVPKDTQTVPGAIDHDFKFGFSYHLGGSYDLTEQLAIRLGGLYDPTVIKDPPQPTQVEQPQLPPHKVFTPTTTETRPDATESILPNGNRLVHYGSFTTEYRPDGSVMRTTDPDSTKEFRPDGSLIREIVSDGSIHEYHLDGSYVFTDPNRITTEYRRDGSWTTTFRDGSSIKVGKDGSMEFHDPPRPGQVEQPALPEHEVFGDVPHVEDKSHSMEIM